MWINAKEQLPVVVDGIRQNVLVWCIYKACIECNVAFYADEDGWISAETDYTLDCVVTHWEPLPAPPKSEAVEAVEQPLTTKGSSLRTQFYNYVCHFVGRCTKFCFTFLL